MTYAGCSDNQILCLIYSYVPVTLINKYPLFPAKQLLGTHDNDNDDDDDDDDDGYDDDDDDDDDGYDDDDDDDDDDNDDDKDKTLLTTRVYRLGVSGMAVPSANIMVVLFVQNIEVNWLGGLHTNLKCELQNCMKIATVVFEI